MALEDAMAALTVALEKNTAALLAGGGAAAETPAATGKGKGKGKQTTQTPDPLEEATGPTLDEVRASLFLVRDNVSRDEAKKIMKSVGGSDTVDGIQPDKFKAVTDACQKALDAKKNPGADDGL